MQELKLKRVYRHFKGDFYLTEDVARDSETGTEYVRLLREKNDAALDAVYAPGRCFSARWIGKSTPTVPRNTGLSCRKSPASPVTNNRLNQEATAVQTAVASCLHMKCETSVALLAGQKNASSSSSFAMQ